MSLRLGDKMIAGNGKPGKDFSIDGQYNNYEEMIQANPNPQSDLAFQLVDTKDVWQYSRLQTKWINLGPLKGAKGDKGDTGDQGIQGIQGIPGKDGKNGTNGTDGERGPVGPQGPAGQNGKDGERGPEGPIGPKGPEGPQGIQGIPGKDGTNGTNGKDGDQGPIGPEGPQGIQGIPGKSAYQSAQDGGYVGTEEAFNQSISRVIYSGTTEPDNSIGKDGDIYVKYDA